MFGRFELREISEMGENRNTYTLHRMVLFSIFILKIFAVTHFERANTW